MREETVLPFKLERTDEKLTAHAGLVLAHEFHVGLSVDRLLDALVPGPGRNRWYRVSEVVLPVVLTSPLDRSGDTNQVHIGCWAA